MINRTLSPEWKLWIWSNIVNGYDKESIFNVLLNNGFEYNLIKKELMRRLYADIMDSTIMQERIMSKL